MTSTALKIFALILMTIDHIGACFPGTPIWLRWIGRLSAPLFFFCAAEGFYHTHDKKLYLKRLYFMSLFMVIWESLISWSCRLAALNVHFSNNIFSSIFRVALIMYILEKTKNSISKRIKYLSLFALYLAVFSFILLSIGDPITSLGLREIPIIGDIDYILYTALGVSADGSHFLLAMGIIFYCCRKSKKKLAISYSIYCVLYFLIFVFDIPPRIGIYLQLIGIPADIVYYLQVPFGLIGIPLSPFSSGDFINSLLYVNSQWMMIFALPFMLMYNGEKGKGYKHFFYVYYPLHLTVFNIIAAVIK